MLLRVVGERRPRRLEGARRGGRGKAALRLGSRELRDATRSVAVRFTGIVVLYLGENGGRG
eukprot:13451050-Alexandrium_andersonii.AAC.1